MTAFLTELPNARILCALRRKRAKWGLEASLCSRRPTRRTPFRARFFVSGHPYPDSYGRAHVGSLRARRVLERGLPTCVRPITLLEGGERADANSLGELAMSCDGHGCSAPKLPQVFNDLDQLLGDLTGLQEAAEQLTFFCDLNDPRIINMLCSIHRSERMIAAKIQERLDVVFAEHGKTARAAA